jgi:hypothetical protein
MQDNFHIGDIISITNVDTPQWARERWRVLAIAEDRVELEPVRDDGSLDKSRHHAEISVDPFTGRVGLISRQKMEQEDGWDG